MGKVKKKSISDEDVLKTKMYQFPMGKVKGIPVPDQVIFLDMYQFPMGKVKGEEVSHIISPGSMRINSLWER